MSEPGQNLQGSPPPQSSLLPWPESDKPRHAVLPNDWERFPHPEELEYLPDGPQTPYELRQIVKRSLNRHESESSKFPQIKPKIQKPEAQSALAPRPLEGTPERHHRDSLASADSWETCRGGTEIPSAATVDATLVPSPLNVLSPKPRELKPKSSFLASKLERLGAKIEKPEPTPSRRSSRNSEQQTSVATGYVLCKTRNEQRLILDSECVSCLEDLPKSDLTPLSCTHSYCKPCLTTLITIAMQTESLFPPKCCLTEIPLKTVLYALDNEQRSSFKQKAAEWAQPTEKRWYCPEPKCAKWIAPSKMNRSWTTCLICPHCQTSICRTCRGLAHGQDTNCPQDFGLNAMLDIAEREGWRRCYNCRSLVEKTSGCRHMTCTCKAQFCYTCGSRWKTCGCTEVDQVRREEVLRERRRALDSEARREEEEIARAIAEVEAAERREAQEREAAERKMEEERQREEEELRRLEELRIAEEEQRRKDEEAAERKKIEVIKSSIEERTSTLAKMLVELVQFQQMALISRHEDMTQNIKKDSDTRLARKEKDYESQKQKLMTNIEKRSKLLKQKHDAETYTTTSRHEEEEDAMFMQVQLHLRGKPNRETREKTMVEGLTRSHKDELARLIGRQTGESIDLREVATMEAKGLEHGHRAQFEEIKNMTEVKIADLDRAIMAERHRFEAVTHRRHALLEEMRKDLLETMGESNLLEEWEALPFPEAAPTTNVSKGRRDLPTPPASPDKAKKILATTVRTDLVSSAAPRAKPPKPSLFISTVMTETTSTTPQLSLNPQRRAPIVDKFCRWSFLGGLGKKEHLDEQTFKSMLRRTVGDAF
jgi:hypothetical protein